MGQPLNLISLERKCSRFPFRYALISFSHFSLLYKRFQKLHSVFEYSQLFKCFLKRRIIIIIVCIIIKCLLLIYFVKFCVRQISNFWYHSSIIPASMSSRNCFFSGAWFLPWKQLLIFINQWINGGLQDDCQTSCISSSRSSFRFFYV